MLDPQAFGGGFVDPVYQSQAVFRAVMDAMARPGSVHAIARETLLPPAPLSPCAAAVALTLCDHDTPVWLDPLLAKAPGLAEWLTFHTGAPVTGDSRRAAFAFIRHGETLPEFGKFAAGTGEFSDRSVTLIVQMESLAGGDAMRLSGPGVLGSRLFAPHPLPDGFVTRWSANNALFPRGVDLVLCSADAVAALPRSTRITKQAAN